MDAPDQVIAVAGFLEKYKNNSDLVATALGWTLMELKKFRAVNRDALEQARKQIKENDVKGVPPSDIEILIADDPPPPLPTVIPSNEDLAKLQESEDQKFKGDLQSIGLTESEAAEAYDLQKFNQGNFTRSMDMVSANVTRTGLRFGTEQGHLIKRLAEVRAAIAEFGGFNCEERERWVKEEAYLGRQLVEVGRVMLAIQDVWNRGATQMALIRARLGGKGKAGGLSVKPGFGPAITIQSSQKN